jgi:hypothetical protein
MTKNTKAAKPEVPAAERVDMNDPALTDAEAVAINLGLTEAPAAPEGE